MPYQYSSSALKDINKFRAMVGLRPVIVKNTHCLSCHRAFESQDYPRQRLCVSCRSDTDDLSEYNTSI